MPYNQTAKITKPCKSSFHFPSLAITFQLSSILGFGLFPVATMRNNQIDFEFFEPFSERVTVVGLIGDHPQWSFSRTPSAGTRNFYCFERSFGERDFGGRCRGKEASQRNTLAVDHHHPLCSFSFFVFPT